MMSGKGIYTYVTYVNLISWPLKLISTAIKM